MKFWRGNKIDAEFKMPVAEVAAAFVEWFRGEPGADDAIRDALPLERLLRWWLSDGEHFNSVWEAETGDESFDRLYPLVRDAIWPPRIPSTPAERQAFRATTRPTGHGRSPR
jgi:hypothetical protein